MLRSVLMFSSASSLNRARVSSFSFWALASRWSSRRLTKLSRSFSSVIEPYSFRRASFRALSIGSTIWSSNTAGMHSDEHLLWFVSSTEPTEAVSFNSFYFGLHGLLLLFCNTLYPDLFVVAAGFNLIAFCVLLSIELIISYILYLLFILPQFPTKPSTSPPLINL